MEYTVITGIGIRYLATQTSAETPVSYSATCVRDDDDIEAYIRELGSKMSGKYHPITTTPEERAYLTDPQALMYVTVSVRDKMFHTLFELRGDVSPLAYTVFNKYKELKCLQLPV